MFNIILPNKTRFHYSSCISCSKLIKENKANLEILPIYGEIAYFILFSIKYGAHLLNSLIFKNSLLYHYNSWQNILLFKAHALYFWIKKPLLIQIFFKNCTEAEYYNTRVGIFWVTRFRYYKFHKVSWNVGKITGLKLVLVNILLSYKIYSSF